MERAVGVEGEGMEQATATATATPPSSTSKTKRVRPKSSAILGVRTPVTAPPGWKGGPENRHHKYRGVRQRMWGRWVSEFREPNGGKRHWLGSFDTAAEAALAYDRAAMAIFGSRAIVNFPSAISIPTAQPVECHPMSSSPSAAAASVFVKHKLKPVAAAASVLAEHGVKPMMAATSVLDEHEVKPMFIAPVFGEHEVKPMITASVFGEREVKPMVAAFSECEVKPIVTSSVFGEHEVKPTTVHGGDDGMGITQHWDASWAEREEAYVDYLKDIAMYIDVDPITEKLAYHPDICSEYSQVGGFDAEFTISPLWELGD